MWVPRHLLRRFAHLGEACFHNKSHQQFNCKKIYCSGMVRVELPLGTERLDLCRSKARSKAVMLLHEYHHLVGVVIFMVMS